MADNWRRMIFLANEGTFAVGTMTVALVVALGGVFGLGAYVLYCDRKNRLGESEFAGVRPAELHDSHDRYANIETHPVRAAPAEELAPTQPAVAHSEPQAPPVTRPRRARPPQSH